MYQRLKLASKDFKRVTGVTYQKVGDGSGRLERVVGLEGKRGVEPWSPEDQLSRPSARLRQEPKPQIIFNFLNFFYGRFLDFSPS
jgi:hypothetical protein